MSQSAASQAVLQIERQLGVRLIDRSKRPLALTPEGRAYYEGCRDVIDRYVEVEGRIHGLAKAAGNRVVVASIYSVGLYDMNQYVRRFLTRHPGGSLRLEYLHPEKVYESVLNEETDLGVVSFPRSMRVLRVIPWREEPMVLVCHPSHRFVGRCVVSVRALDGERFVAFDGNLAIRRHIDRWLRSKDVEVRVEMAFDNIEAIKRGVEIGAGVSILPAPTIRAELASGSLVSAELEGFGLVRPLSIIHRRGRMLTPAMRSFIELLKRDEIGSIGPDEDSGESEDSVAGGGGMEMTEQMPTVATV